MEITSEEARAERLKEAIISQDQEYLDGFERGRELAFNNTLPDSNEEFPQAVLDGIESALQTKNAVETEGMRNRVFVQPHVLGGLEVITFGSDGTKNSARITIEAAATLKVLLEMWMTTMLQQQFFETSQQMQAVQQQTIIPGR